MLALNCICSYLNWEGARLTLPAPVMEAYHFLPFSSVSTLGGLPFPYFPIPLVFEYVWSLFSYLPNTVLFLYYGPCIRLGFK